MKKFLFACALLLNSLTIIYTNVYASPAPTTQECKGIKLNTNMPFVGNCIETSDTSKTNEE